MPQTALHRPPKLYGLLVGITDYQSTIVLDNGQVYFPGLSACTRDVDNVEQYLVDQSGYECVIETMKNANATKEKIMQAFDEHLGKAAAGDVALFYFSGHGTQEYTSRELFQSETDGRLEDIVCYYNGPDEHFLLADKELRWMINSIASKGAHVVCMFDCCHSGDNTRNEGILAKTFSNVVEKRAAYIFSQRRWNDFIFSGDITEDDIRKYGDRQLLQEGRHVQLSACESDDVAVEVDGTSVFTSTLLAILEQCGGVITYQNLNGRLRQYLRNVFEQRPTIYAAPVAEGMEHLNFLNRPGRPGENVYGEITFNAAGGWTIDRGILHGLSPGNAIVILNKSGGEMYDGQVAKLMFDHALVTIDGALNEGKVYRAKVTAYREINIRLHVAANDAPLTALQTIMEALSAHANVTLVEDELQSEYALRCMNGCYYLTYPGEAFQPLAQLWYAANPAITISAWMDHLVQWEFVKRLSNDAKGNTEKSISIEIAREQPYQQYHPVRHVEKIFLYELDNTWQHHIKIRIRNISRTKMYCSVLYLGSDFSVTNRYLSPLIATLEPGSIEELQWNGNPLIRLSLSDRAKTYNRKTWSGYFKFIVSPERFDTTSLNLVPLASAHRNDTGVEREEDQAEQSFCWETQIVELQFRNPLYNKINRGDIVAKLEDARYSDYMLGLYFDADAHHTGYQLKPQLDNEHDNILSRAALANEERGRNNLFMKKSGAGNQTNIVAYGDAWFHDHRQTDIVDALKRVYNVYVLPRNGVLSLVGSDAVNTAASDILDALQGTRSALLLLSAGLADIVKAASQNAGMEAIIGNFSDLVTHICNRAPQVKIILHGYTYPLQQPDGTMMIGNVKVQGDDYGNYIDRFNSALQNFCATQNNVTCLDLRGAGKDVNKNAEDLLLKISSIYIRQIEEALASSPATH